MPGGALRILGGRIAAMGTAAAVARRPGEPVVDLPGAALLPGFVNAHAHLELSGLEGRFPPAPFLTWVKDVIAFRKAGGDYAAWARIGARRLVQDGTTAVGDFATGAWALEALAEAGLRGVVYRELIGPEPAQAPGILAEAAAWLAGPSPARLRRGLAPHAPYTVSEPLLRALAGLAAPRAVHVSELAEEVALLTGDRGPLRDRMRERGIAWTSPRQRARPVPYLAACGVLGPGSLAVHANYLDDADVACLAARGASVVFCPGSHAFFGHRDHPLPRLLEAGIPLALGTDSLASNDGLSMRREMRRAAEAFPGLPASRILEMATLGGAAALGLAHEAGSLELGKAADLVAVAVPDGQDPRDAVVRAEPAVLEVWASGRPVLTRPGPAL